LIERVRECSKMLLEIIPHFDVWKFYENALGFLVKAFFSGGLEQLLWHITVIEALLGQKVESGLTNLLKKRVGTILGENAVDQKTIRKNFEELYDFRSKLVHGDPGILEKEIFQGHLGRARDLARSIIVWMLRYLFAISQITPEGGYVPSKDDLLAVLDMNPAMRPLISSAMTKLPSTFPNLQEWLR
jgi:hypothetical protein